MGGVVHEDDAWREPPGDCSMYERKDGLHRWTGLPLEVAMWAVLMGRLPFLQCKTRDMLYGVLRGGAGALLTAPMTMSALPCSATCDGRE